MENNLKGLPRQQSRVIKKQIYFDLLNNRVITVQE